MLTNCTVTSLASGSRPRRSRLLFKMFVMALTTTMSLGLGLDGELLALVESLRRLAVL